MTVPLRSRSVKPQSLTTRRIRGGTSASNDSSEERGAALGRSASRRSRRRQPAEGGQIAEIAEEERSNSRSSMDDEELKERNDMVRNQKKNFLCKTLIEQAREMCYNHAAVYKEFDTIYQKVVIRLQDWELFDDEEISQACLALKVIANSGQMIHLSMEKNMRRIFTIFGQADVPKNIQANILDIFIIIAKNIGLRKIFLSPLIFPTMAELSLSFVEDEKQKKNEICVNCIKLLCMICTPRTNKFYIPGETNVAERLRKKAFDSGLFSLLTHIARELKTKQCEEYQQMREYIYVKVFNYSDLADLNYHVRLLKVLKERQDGSGIQIEENPEK